jgi:uncharacterized protein YuzE
MKIQYFQETDTLYIEFKASEVAETKDLDEDTLLDVDSDGNICSITIEHASQRADIPRFSYEQVVAASWRCFCRPWRDWISFRNAFPSTEVLGYFRGGHQWLGYIVYGII